MKIYIISLVVGILAGLLYGVLQVRSPAPPVAALIGLLGMLIGEQMIPFGKQLVADNPFSAEKIATPIDTPATRHPKIVSIAKDIKNDESLLKWQDAEKWLCGKQDVK